VRGSTRVAVVRSLPRWSWIPTGDSISILLDKPFVPQDVGDRLRPVPGSGAVARGQLEAAKLGILCASAAAGVLGLSVGRFLLSGVLGPEAARTDEQAESSTSA
jgi:hypothetical protein